MNNQAIVSVPSLEKKMKGCQSLENSLLPHQTGEASDETMPKLVAA